MRKSFELGTKMKIPTTKQGASPEGSNVIERAKRNGQDFLYYKGIKLALGGEWVHVLDDKWNIEQSGDYFDDIDITPYASSTPKTKRKTISKELILKMMHAAALEATNQWKAGEDVEIDLLEIFNEHINKSISS